MRLLLDTHVLLWWVIGDPRLPSTVADVVSDEGSTVHVSAVSAAEVAVKRSVGKLGRPTVEEAFAEPGLEELPFRAAHAEVLQTLPLHHRDPFDRMLVAQALAEGLVLVTLDDKVRRYDVPVLPPRGA
ncbi:type II toxin-antitoxin system VapC family toxin [Klenkia sp. PcliD-1-E]|uniref:type II toxin-antitoxin system VapC family toxin n=1 Tax=Klenkia sp. PcliD-1-E TaxID=2954492 RepID=UPI002097B882|nr:type II toxin-antitoxin system VapC family toxin [Klenkia sp. PcliD-1-E]MCO7222569.1 type II toxin-antitoxin system VapC family toxin [Klenkia sp. PcliD-1-E]